MGEQGIEYVPAALRRFVYQITAYACRLRVNATTHSVFLRGRLLGVLTEGRVSCYFRTPSGRGRLYPSIESFDSSVAAVSGR